MRKILNLGLAVLTASALLTGCNCYKKMMTNAAKDITVSAAPELVSLKGDNAVTTVTVNIPAKAFDKNGVLKITPVLASALDGTEVAGAPVFFQGEAVTDNYTVVPYTGGQFSFQVAIPYSPALRLSQLVLKAEAKCLKNGNKIKEFTALPQAIWVTDGVNAMQLMADNYAKVALAPDGFQRVTNVSESAKIMFQVNQANVRTSELNKAEIKELEKFILDNSGDAKKKVGEVVTQAYASPEGPIAHNDKLSKSRGSSTEKNVAARFKRDKIKGTAFDVHALGEDWAGFQELVQASDIPDKALILQVLSRFSDPMVREQQIRNMSAAYKVLADKILPELRRSQMTVNVAIEGLTDAELRDAVANNISSLKVEEQLFAATLFTDNADKLKIYKQAADQYGDYRAFNNMGVALANGGQFDAAKVAFLKAGTLNAQDPYVINNLGVVALAEGKKAEAAKFFAASNTAESKYNQGLVELANGNYAGATRSLDGYNQALAEYLNGNVAKAKQQLSGMDTWRANYLKAVIASQEGNKDAVLSNLGRAASQNTEVSALAATDVNFINYFEDAGFKAIAPVNANFKYPRTGVAEVIDQAAAKAEAKAAKKAAKEAAKAE